MSNYLPVKIEKNGSTENLGQELLHDENNSAEAIRTNTVDFFIN
jgi:hypothetical protein